MNPIGALVLKLLGRSILMLAVVGLVGSALIFAAVNVLGGDAATVILGRSATPRALAALREQLGLDQPLVPQYLDWLGGFLRGDLGQTYASGNDIGSLISDRIGPSLALAIGAVIISTVVGVAVGTWAALRNGKARTALANVGAQVGISVPHFWVGILLILAFALQRNWFPTGGYVPWSEDPVECVRSLVLPCVTLAIPSSAVFIRFVRSSMLDVLNEDYMRAAQARGMTRTGAALKHGVRNASIPLFTVATLQLGGLIGGSVVIEKVFSIPGLGNLLVDAVLQRETVLVQSLAMVQLLIILGLNAVMDVCYGLLDPRIRTNPGRMIGAA